MILIIFGIKNSFKYSVLNRYSFSESHSIENTYFFNITEYIFYRVKKICKCIINALPKTVLGKIHLIICNKRFIINLHMHSPFLISYSNISGIQKRCGVVSFSRWPLRGLLFYIQWTFGGIHPAITRRQTIFKSGIFINLAIYQVGITD